MTLGELKAKRRANLELTKQEIAYLEKMENAFHYDGMEIPELELMTDEEVEAFQLQSLKEWGKQFNSKNK